MDRGGGLCRRRLVLSSDPATVIFPRVWACVNVSSRPTVPIDACEGESM